MPRQLPWKNNGGGASCTQTVNPSIQNTKTKSSEIPDDIDDDFFDGAVLTISTKNSGKGKAKATSESDDALPEAGTATSRTTTKPKAAEQRDRATSSSPPPLADHAPPHDEPLRKGVSKFDLRDDEWMMVEDEFLETANLFSRHLHIAEYDRLKATIEAKKRGAEVARPVVAGAKRSADGEMKEWGRFQENRQKKAIRDVFASQDESSERNGASSRPKPSNVSSMILKPVQNTSTSQETDSDDLDTPRPPKPRAPSPASTAVAKPLPATRQRPAYLETPKPATESFVKPAPPATKASVKSRSRPSRMTPFDMLDEYATPAFDTRAPPTPSFRHEPRSQSTRSNYASSQTSQPTHTRADKPRRSIDLLDDQGSARDAGGISKDVADRIAKKKADRATQGDGKEKKRTTDVDDIPTFLF